MIGRGQVRHSSPRYHNSLNCVYYSFIAHELTMKQAVQATPASESLHGEMKQRSSIWMLAQL